MEEYFTTPTEEQEKNTHYKQNKYWINGVKVNKQDCESLQLINAQLQQVYESNLLKY